VGFLYVCCLRLKEILIN